MTQAGEVDRRVSGRGGLEMPALGLGTSRMGENRARRREEVEALKLGLDLGMSLIDTAEMYGHGGAEEVVAEAVRDRREDVFLVTKVLPQNASRKGTVRAAEASLKRLSTEWIDLYLLHWEGRHPIDETLEAFGELREAGKIRHFGVSNLTVRALEEAERHPLGREIAANQVKYHLGQRGIERDLLSWCEKSAVAIMAYSPLDEARLPLRPALSEVAQRHEITPECAAIAWSLRHPLVASIPKATNPDHVRANARALAVSLTPEDLAALDRDYPPR